MPIGHRVVPAYWMGRMLMPQLEYYIYVLKNIAVCRGFFMAVKVGMEV